MAFDACMMRAVLSEFSRDFPDAKIEKVLEPQNDEIDLVIHSGRVSKRLVFNVGPNAPRLQLSDIAKENPKQAPVFCMQLRKHLVGARIISVSQPNFDRIAVFTLSCYDEMGFKSEKKLICEIMGKYANLILTDSADKIITAMKLIDFAASSVRQVLPGLKYTLPEKQDKLSTLDVDRAAFFSRLAEFPSERTLEKFITSTYSGIATRIAREIAYRASGRLDAPVSSASSEEFYKAFSAWQNELISESYTPTAVIGADGKPIDYSYTPLTHFEGGASIKFYSSFRELFDAYFAEKDRAERIHQRAVDLIRLISGAISRTEKKLSLQREALRDSKKGEEISPFLRGGWDFLLSASTDVAKVFCFLRSHTLALCLRHALAVWFLMPFLCLVAKKWRKKRRQDVPSWNSLSARANDVALALHSCLREDKQIQILCWRFDIKTPTRK